MVYADKIVQVAPGRRLQCGVDRTAAIHLRLQQDTQTVLPSTPGDDLELGGPLRLQAKAFEVTDRPSIVIREHTFAGIPLSDLCELGMLPAKVTEFLSAAVRSKQSIVISGIQGGGKTTFLRALAMEMNPLEAVGVIETDPELFLHKLPGRGRTVNYVARSATGEGIGPDGKPIGEYTVQTHLISSLRQNLSRIIVGEVRGDEAATMFEAMQAGAGSLSTIHAQHANATIERLVTAAARGGIMSQVDAYRQIAVNINLIVHLGAEDLRPQGGDFRRFVNQIIEISGFRDTADGTGTTYMPATDVLYDVRNRESYHSTKRCPTRCGRPSTPKDGNHELRPRATPGYGSSIRLPPGSSTGPAHLSSRRAEPFSGDTHRARPLRDGSRDPARRRPPRARYRHGHRAAGDRIATPPRIRQAASASVDGGALEPAHPPTPRTAGPNARPQAGRRRRILADRLRHHRLAGDPSRDPRNPPAGPVAANEPQRRRHRADRGRRNVGPLATLPSPGRVENALEGALQASLAAAPEPIKPEITALVTRMRARSST